MNYYSFYLGDVKANRKQWLHVDIKIPAVDIKRAIILYEFCESLRMSKGSISPEKMGYPIPNRVYVDYKYRQVIEYERLHTPYHGYTQHRFKKKRLYHRSDILKLFLR